MAEKEEENWRKKHQFPLKVPPQTKLDGFCEHSSTNIENYCLIVVACNQPVKLKFISIQSSRLTYAVQT